jgi:choline dehydrogenase-like flavoprotein
MDFLRGYNFQGRGERLEWKDNSERLKGFGANFKDQITKPGPWKVWMGGWGECLPYHENKISLSDVVDQWGMPLIEIDFSFKENEQLMIKDIQKCGVEMLEQAGFTSVSSFSYDAPGGTTVHEMGTARMGHDPETSVLNRFNQIHTVKNVYVTDGSCMTSSACQNPSLTYMALTSRACAHAFKELKSGNL